MVNDVPEARMWSEWLADTLGRSTLDPAPHSGRLQRVPTAELGASGGAAEPACESSDWEEVTGLLIHEGFGAEYPDA